MNDIDSPRELDEGQKSILQATEKLFQSVKEYGLKMNFLDLVCKYCHREFGHAESEDGFPWDVEFVCDKQDCQEKYLCKLITSSKTKQKESN